MPGFLLHVGAKVNCLHAGEATPVVPNGRVLVSSQPTATLATAYSIVGCSLPTSAGGPCATAQWARGAARVYSNFLPVLLQDSQAVCAPTGTPLIPTVVQPRVFGM